MGRQASICPAVPDRFWTGPTDGSWMPRTRRPGYTERTEHLLGAVRALNNLAVWSITRWDHPDSGDAALSALQEADRLLNEVPVGGDLRGGVFFNLGQYIAGMAREAGHYLGLARSYGISVADRIGDLPSASSVRQQAGAAPSDDVRLDEEPDNAMLNGKTQLMFWAAVGDTGHVRTLILRGADVDAVDEDGDSALLYAVSKGHRDVAELLLKYGANPDVCGDSGVPIRLAASRGWAEMVRILAAEGARVDAPSTVMGTRGVTATMVAAGGGYVDCLRALLELGANPDLVDADGDSALFYAQSNGQTATADVLTARKTTHTR